MEAQATGGRDGPAGLPRAGRLDAAPLDAAPAGAEQASARRPLVPAATAFALFAFALVMPFFILKPGAGAMGTGLGPAAWPRAALALLAVFTFVWVLREIWAVMDQVRAPLLAPPREDGAYSYRKAVVGLVLIVLYGAMIPVTGFALTTAAFIALWCLYGGIRNPLALLAIPLAGTAAILWVFMGLALMPLSRGQGVFGEFSIALLRALAIY